MTTKHYMAIVTFSTSGNPDVALLQKMKDYSDVDPELLRNHIPIFEKLL
jgi:hypothetical protein